MGIGSMLDKAAGTHEKKYFLMNKDRVVCEFIIRGEGILEECISIKGTENIPLYFGSIDSWVNARSSAKHRKHIAKILDECGGNTPSGFIRLTHCLSVNDTFWVKSDIEDLEWNSVNLYNNDFSEIVSHAAFDGIGLCGEQFSTTSPELTTDGMFDKCWIKNADSIYLIKTGSTGYSNAGREPYSEVLASQVFNKILPDNSVSYELRAFRGRTVSACKLFTDERYSYLPYSVFMRTVQRIPEILKTFGEYGCDDIFRGMIIGDCVTFNTDRHFNNFGWLCDSDTMKRITMAPVFDFNLSELTYADDIVGFPDLDAYLSDCKPTLGDDWVTPAQALMTSKYKSILINLKDLELKIDCDEKFTEDRLRKINIAKNVQIDRILGRQAFYQFN